MAKARSPKRARALELWQASGGKLPLKEIAKQLDVSDTQIRKWKSIDKWEMGKGNVTNTEEAYKSNITNKNDKDKGNEKPKRKRGGQPGNDNAKGHGAPVGNDNAEGNHGGAPKRNTNAVKTGEYQTLWLDYLSEEERRVYERIDVDKLKQVNEDIRLLTWRENSMMKRIHELRDGIDNVETETVREMRAKQLPIPVYDEAAGGMMQKTTTVRQLEIKEIRKKEKSMLGEILRIEEALTRVQDKKAKFLQTKHKMELDLERLALDREKARIDAARLQMDKEKLSMPDLTSENKIMIYLPGNGRDANGD